jgi:hypothetical protein
MHRENPIPYTIYITSLSSIYKIRGIGVQGAGLSLKT